MSGEKNLILLLKSMEPELDSEEFIFCTSAEAGHEINENIAWAVISEDEGKTFILKKEIADRNGILYESVFKRITLKIHSSLDAVGLTASVSAKLTEQGISANIVAGYYHDHIFVQSKNADRALSGLKELSYGAKTGKFIV